MTKFWTGLELLSYMVGAFFSFILGYITLVIAFEGEIYMRHLKGFNECWIEFGMLLILLGIYCILTIRQIGRILK